LAESGYIAQVAKEAKQTKDKRNPPSDGLWSGGLHRRISFEIDFASSGVRRVARVAGSDNLRAELRGLGACCCSLDGSPAELGMTYPEQAEPNLQMLCFRLSASRTKDCTENDKHDCHSYQEAEVILAPVVVDFVDLTTLVDEG
jgi:hypothetical protein